MLKKRIIPCLDIANGRTVKGVNFVDLRDAGDPVELARRYADQGADELVFLDITATIESRRAMHHLVERVAAVVNIPFTVGGGIRSDDDVKVLLDSGADKVSINSMAVAKPQEVRELSQSFGSQCIVVAVDSKHIQGKHYVFTHGGRRQTSIETLDHCQSVESMGAGEILLTSMDHDGTKSGFALSLTSLIASELNIPVIASGGAGHPDHFEDLFINTPASAGLAASIFHYGSVSIPDLKMQLLNSRIPIRK